VKFNPVIIASLNANLTSLSFELPFNFWNIW